MPLELSLHRIIERYNVLKKPTNQFEEYFKRNPNLYKAALIANHIFRAVAMATFYTCLPFAAPINLAICFAGSLFYRLTVETHCAYKFALPAFAGGVAFPMALTAVSSLVSGVALASLGATALACAALLPLAAYGTYVILTVSYDVDHK